MDWPCVMINSVSCHARPCSGLDNKLYGCPNFKRFALAAIWKNRLQVGKDRRREVSYCSPDRRRKCIGIVAGTIVGSGHILMSCDASADRIC